MCLPRGLYSYRRASIDPFRPLCAPDSSRKTRRPRPKKITEPKIAVEEIIVAQPRIIGMSSEINIPSNIPIAPPLKLSNTDSIRNCVLIAAERAPIAILMPISRVRSVTETSMIFMMPIPPTSSETPAIAAKKQGHDTVCRVCGRGNVGLISNKKIVVSFGASLCR